MKVTQEDVVSRQTALHIELEEGDLSEYLDRGYRRVVQRTMIPGFRKGKAPRAIVERFVGRESLLQEAADFMLPDITQRAVAAQDLETVGTPSVELLDLEPVTVKATVALTPLVDIDGYRDIRVAEKTVEITEDDVQERLERLRKDSSSWEPVERPVKLDDMLTMNVVGHVGESDILNEKDATYVPEKDGILPFPGFSEHLVGVEVDVPKEFTLTIPEDRPDAALAGKEAHFIVTVTDVKERRLPELDDEFAKSAGDGYKSFSELREAVESDLEAEAERAQSAQYREAALEGLGGVTKVELPPLLIDHEVEHLVSRRDQFVDRLDIRMDDYLRFTGKTEEQIREEMREQAVSQLNRSYALTDLAEREELAVSDEEIDKETQQIAATSGERAESLKRRGLDSEEVRGSIRETLLVGKALDRLVAIARGEAPEPGVTTPSATTRPDEGEGGTQP